MGKQYWSKWGGARAGEVKEQLDVWSCQSCGREQVKILPQYLMKDEENTEVFRICTLCKHTSLIGKYVSIIDLIQNVRKRDLVITVENLVTISFRW